jgi:ATP-binding cassette, subfamily G (WHITE), member 2, PDR
MTDQHSVMVSPKDLPGFWRFVWRASPLTYLIAGLSLAGFTNAKITCSDTQLLMIKPPRGTTCGVYLEPYVQDAGGEIYNLAESTNCQYCPTSCPEFTATGK